MRSLLTLPGVFGILRVEPKTPLGRFASTLSMACFFASVHWKSTASIRSFQAGSGLIEYPAKGNMPAVPRRFSTPGLFCVLRKATTKKSWRFPMLRFFLSSRYLRLRHRLLSLLTTLAGRAGATLALGALLALPVLYFVEVAR